MEPADAPLVREAVAERLTRLGGAARRVAGDRVVGPGTLAVEVAERHGEGPHHVDLGFLLNPDRPDAPVIWDCATGAGSTTRPERT